MKHNYIKNVSMYCPVCGCNSFKSVENISTPLSETNDNILIKCANCLVKFTKGELKEKNQDIINASINELKQEVIVDLKKELELMLKNTFTRR